VIHPLPVPTSSTRLRGCGSRSSSRSTTAGCDYL
jgi:hypothetical protein